MECKKMCMICEKEFIARSGIAKYCPECRGNKNKSVKVPSRQSPKHSLTQVLKMLEKYNSEHGTSYTYGRFAELLDSGKIKR